MSTTYILAAAWLLVTIPMVEEGWFKYQLNRVKYGRVDNAALSYDISMRAGDFMKTPWSLMGRLRKRLRRRMTIVGYALATIYLIFLFVL